MNDDARNLGRSIIAHHSKSFSLASRLLPGDVRDRAVIVYAWCRRADDAVDLAAAGNAATALQTLRRELDAVYGEAPLDDPILSAFRQITRTCQIPRHYPQELLEGLAMDAQGTHYDTLSSLLRYCYRVAGTVGLMMCHVMGVRDEDATRNATHLGVAMQITNICRDVEEDWKRGRLYVPADLLQQHGRAPLRAGGPGAALQQARTGVAHAVARLLDEADAYYASGNRGIASLSWRCGLAVRTASKVYAAIGNRVREKKCDPLAGRAWVSNRGKLLLVGAAVLQCLSEGWRVGRHRNRRTPTLPEHVVVAEDVLPLETQTNASRPLVESHSP